MRVSRRRCSGDDRGAVLILVAAFSLVAIIFLAFVVDIGNQRQDRRQLTTATDASALDVAGRWAANELVPLDDFTLISAGIYDCTAEASDYLDRNRAVEPGDYECRAEVRSDRLASVTVYAAGTTPYQVAPAIGIDSGAIGSRTSVRITAAAGGGLRPFALCAGHQPLADWLASPGANNDAVERLTISADKFLPAACGQNNGNWGFVQFETQGSGVGNGNDDKLAGTIRNGSDDEVNAYVTTDGSHRNRCTQSYAAQKAEALGVTCLFNVTGAGGWNNNNTMQAFEHLIGPPAVTFALPIYDQIVPLQGQSTGFPVIAFAEARLVSYVQGGAKDNSVTLDVVRTYSVPPGRITATNHILDICDVGTIGGAAMAGFETSCHAPGTGGTATPPPPVDPAPTCRVVEVDPPAQDATVDASGRLTGPRTVAVTVEDAAQCPDLALDAVAGNTVPHSSVSQSGNVFTFTFAANTTFAPSGTTYVLEVIQGGTVRDDSARLTTTATATGGPCTVGTPTFPAPARSGNNLTADLVVTVPISNIEQCSSVAVRVVRLNSSSQTALQQVSLAPDDPRRATFKGANPNRAMTWSSGNYEVRVYVNGAAAAAATAPFTL